MKLKRIEERMIGDGTRFAVSQKRYEPLKRWLVFLLTVGCAGALFAWVLRLDLRPHWSLETLLVASGLVLFVASLALIAGMFSTATFAATRRSSAAFVVRADGITIESKARSSAPPAMHRDEIAGPFVRVDEVIDEEASATTMMRMGGEDTALMLAEGARSDAGSADTMLWFLYSGSAASVSVVWRGRQVVLAEALGRDEAEDLAHRIALKLDRLSG